MKVQFILHSGFLVEFEKVAFVFDYYKGKLELPSKEKYIYFFVSHKHVDHFNFAIFDYAKDYPNISFILSNDIKMNDRYMSRKQMPQEAKDKIQYAHKNEEFMLQDRLKVETLTSTDQGVAYIITYQEANMSCPVTIYHAGDLNWWTWQGASEAEEKDMERRYKQEIQKIKGRSFDCAFLPADPRQQERFWWGFDYFMKNTDTKKALPMHAWGQYQYFEELKSLEQTKEYRDRIIEVKEAGQCFEL